MSLRPEIFGFDLARMRSLFGSKNQDLVTAVQTEFERQVAKDPSNYDISFQATFREALGRAINEGVPFQGFETETEPHVYLAVLLAQHQDDLLGTDSNQWEWMSFSDFWDNMGGHRLFDRLLFGRPIFGNQFNSDVLGTYAYLERDEIRELLDWLQELQDEQDDLDGDEERWPGMSDAIKAQLDATSGLASREDLLQDLCRWCDEIAAAEKDLFIYWS